ncbi:hypothetical protein X798_00653 [Onchocerca flexuosa]|uniref:SEA domain-containing protein n=1 Tax=Onchocerca flexuosa TaxID=387005 RepID=A0A238C449_9BILA|nr:hypothetical protein X798_00653 [Onchocerca flexuosa]
MFGLAGKFQRRRESDLEQESNLTTNPKNDLKKSKYGIENKNDSKWSSNLSNDTTSASVGHPITFEVTRSSRKRLLCMLITVSLLLLLLIIAIILAYAMNVLIIKLPSSPSSTTHQPYQFITSTVSPNSTFEPIPLPNFTSQPFPPPFPTPLPPYKPAIVTLPYPSDRLQKRTLLCQMYILNQADEAYVTHNHFKYRQSSHKIQNAIDSQLKQSSLQPYLENVYVCGPHLAVEFSIILLVPSHTNIGLTTVKNVFLSILPGIEEQLNGTHIDRNSFSVQYLYN